MDRRTYAYQRGDIGSDFAKLVTQPWIACPMFISVFPPGKSGFRATESEFALVQDHWNDYSFQTMYHLYCVGRDSAPDRIGSVKILRRGQTKQHPLQVTNSFDSLG